LKRLANLAMRGGLLGEKDARVVQGVIKARFIPAGCEERSVRGGSAETGG
jgi:hypothetical protein